MVVGHFAQHAFFVGVHGSLSWSDGARGARFDFDEAEHVLFPCDQIEVSTRTGGAPAARSDDEPPAAQIEICGALTPASRSEVRRLTVAVERGAIQTIEKALKPVETELFKTGHSGRLSCRRHDPARALKSLFEEQAGELGVEAGGDLFRRGIWRKCDGRADSDLQFA